VLIRNSGFFPLHGNNALGSLDSPLPSTRLLSIAQIESLEHTQCNKAFFFSPFRPSVGSCWRVFLSWKGSVRCVSNRQGARRKMSFRFADFFSFFFFFLSAVSVWVSPPASRKTNEQLNVRIGADERWKDIKLPYTLPLTTRLLLSNHSMILMENMGTAPCRQLRDDEKDCSRRRK
jgi:hypothetical protein